MAQQDGQTKSEEYYDNILTRAEELIDAGIERIYYERDASFLRQLQQLGEQEPDTYSYMTLDLELPKYATDRSDVIAYRDARSMQASLLHWIEQMVTPEMLEMVRKDEIHHLTLRLGHRTLSGYDLREVL